MSFEVNQKRRNGIAKQKDKFSSGEVELEPVACVRRNFLTAFKAELPRIGREIRDNPAG